MIEAIGKNVILKAVKEEKKSIILTSKEEPILYYEVLSIGSSVKDVNVGDKVLIHYGAQKIPFEDNLFVTDIERVYATL